LVEGDRAVLDRRHRSYLFRTWKLALVCTVACAGHNKKPRTGKETPARAAGVNVRGDEMRRNFPVGEPQGAAGLCCRSHALRPA
jgi:hypothetical protein